MRNECFTDCILCCSLSLFAGCGNLRLYHSKRCTLFTTVSVIWKFHLFRTLSDMNQDGSLECEEFIIAMHLTDVVKSGGTLPPQLPLEIVPHQYKHIVGNTATSVGGAAGAGGEERGDTESAPMMAMSFEERRRMNWDKGQQELERRRRELLERQQAEKVCPYFIVGT